MKNLFKTKNLYDHFFSKHKTHVKSEFQIIDLNFHCRCNCGQNLKISMASVANEMDEINKKLT